MSVRAQDRGWRLSFGASWLTLYEKRSRNECLGQLMWAWRTSIVLEGTSCLAHLVQRRARICKAGREKGEGCASAFCPPSVTATQAAPGRQDGVLGKTEDDDGFQAPALSQSVMCLRSGALGDAGFCLHCPSRQILHKGVLCLWSHSVSTEILLFP